MIAPTFPEIDAHAARLTRFPWPILPFVALFVGAVVNLAWVIR